MTVKNLNGTAVNKCKCGSWLQHWVKYGKKPLPTYCCQSECFNKPEVGAHVQKDDKNDRNWYIIPICQKHNKQEESFDIIDGIILAPANVSETCG